MCELKNGHYLSPISLSEAINSKGYEFNAFVDPDEQFILFSAYGRNDDMGQGDLYLSVKKDGHGNKQVNLKNINSTALDYCPFVTWDKKYLFYLVEASYKSPFSKKQTVSDLRKRLLNPAMAWMIFIG